MTAISSMTLCITTVYGLLNLLDSLAPAVEDLVAVEDEHEDYEHYEDNAQDQHC